MYLYYIMSMLILYKDWYIDEKTFINHIIIKQILLEKNKQSNERFTSFMN